MLNETEIIDRPEYIKRLLTWQNENVIKVVTGIRRCGKSTLLKLFQKELLAQGVLPKQIISLNMEELENEPLLDYKELYKYIVTRKQDKSITYVILDEIQNVPSFEKVIDSLQAKSGYDIYITGSNSFLLSGELASLLSGRYIEINLLPLSFKEYCQLNKVKGTAPNSEQQLIEYMKTGGFPFLASLHHPTKEKIDEYLDSIYNTIIIKDIEMRQRRVEKTTGKRKVTDLNLLKSIAKFLASSIGNPITIRSITNYLISNGRRVSQNTVTDYMDVLTEAYLFYPVRRYDIQGKELLQINQKMYMVDLGIRRLLVARQNYDLGFSLENTIFFELLRRGYSVNVGKLKTAEVDFIVSKGDDIAYFQITASLLDENTFNRETIPLQNIKDNYPKYILTLDRFTPGNYNGIKVLNAIDWLLK